MKDYYSVNPAKRRSIMRRKSHGETLESCQYMHPHAAGAAVQLAENFRPNSEESWIKNFQIKMLILYLLFSPTKWKVLEVFFLWDVQRFHDSSDYWTENGLSDFGQTVFDKMKEGIKNNEYKNWILLIDTFKKVTYYQYMNKNTKQRHARARKVKSHFRGQPCFTGFEDKEKNPANQRRKPYKAPRLSYSAEDWN